MNPADVNVNDVKSNMHSNANLQDDNPMLNMNGNIITSNSTTTAKYTDMITAANDPIGNEANPHLNSYTADTLGNDRGVDHIHQPPIHRSIHQNQINSHANANPNGNANANANNIHHSINPSMKAKVFEGLMESIQHLELQEAELRSLINHLHSRKSGAELTNQKLTEELKKKDSEIRFLKTNHELEKRQLEEQNKELKEELQSEYHYFHQIQQNQNQSKNQNQNNQRLSSQSYDDHDDDERKHHDQKENEDLETKSKEKNGNAEKPTPKESETQDPPTNNSSKVEGKTGSNQNQNQSMLPRINQQQMLYAVDSISQNEFEEVFLENIRLDQENQRLALGVKTLTEQVDTLLMEKSAILLDKRLLAEKCDILTIEIGRLHRQQQQEDLTF